MKLLLQRCAEASVTVDGKVIGEIEQGILLFIGVEQGDTSELVNDLARRVCAYRMFNDENGKMNLNVKQAGGAILAVSQFTLAADTRKGLRPGFSTAAPPAEGEYYYKEMVRALTLQGVDVATGRFGADMKVKLVNDGPVTFLLEKMQ